jgi:DNA-binding Xre family transcriptional regulator
VIKIKIPQLLERNNLNATDLMRKGNIAYGTALRLSKGEGSRISFEVLENLCVLFDVGVDEILEYVPEKKK